MGGRARFRAIAKLFAGALLLATATTALAQEQLDPPPPQPDTTTLQELPREPSAPSVPADPPTETEPAGPERVPPDASGLDLSTLETNNLSLLYFDPVQTYLTPYVARSFENALLFHKKLFDWTPWDRTTLLLKDFGDYGNAAARSSPNNAVLLDVAPLSLAMETFTPGERFFTLTNHELAHVATMDVWNRRDAGWRRFFHGKPMPVQEHPLTILYNYLATPRNSVPRWYLEGSAVLFETWMAGGLGRAQGAYDEMFFRAKVRDGERLYSPLGLESEGTAIDFQVGVNDYLYGTRFFSYLALTYGPERVVQWLKRDEGSAAYYSVQFKRVFGRPLNTAWDQWIAFERHYQKANLDRLGKFPLTRTEPLSEGGLGSISRGFVDPKTGLLVAAFRYPGRIGFVGTLDFATGKLRALQEIKGMMLYRVTSLAFDPDARKAFYTEDNYAFRDLVEVDVDSGRKRMLLRDARIGDMVVNPRDKSIWGIRHQNGFATIVRIPPPYAGFNQVHTFAYGETPFDLDISPDGSLVSASYGEVAGKQTLRVWKTKTFESGGGVEEVARLELPPATPEGFVFEPGGTSLVGTAYYTGVSNVFRFDIPTRKFALLSNASTGLFRPIPRSDGSLIVYEFTGDGLAPARMTPTVHEDVGTIDFLGTQVIKKHPQLKEWGVGSPARVPLEQLITERGKYRPGKRMKLAAAYPVVEGYKGIPSLGYHFQFEDPLQFSQVSLTVGVSPTGDLRLRDRLHSKLEYKSLDWRLRWLHNAADFYDLLGPVERSRRGDALIASYNKTRIYDPPRQLDLFGSAALWLGLERLPGAQNIAGPKNILSLEAGAKYTNTRRSLGGVDHEKGIAWRAISSLDIAQGELFPKVSGGIDFGVPLPVANSSVWAYLHAGNAWGDRLSPLGSFYFGAFRNNYVDNREIKRYRELESFPGFDIDQIDARRFGKLTAEINLPPVRFAELGTPAIYLSHLRPALFTGVMATRAAGGTSHRYVSAGGQLDLNFTVALRLPMVFSVGAAAGFEDGDYRKTELLASLKIM